MTHVPIIQHEMNVRRKIQHKPPPEAIFRKPVPLSFQAQEEPSEHSDKEEEPKVKAF